MINKMNSGIITDISNFIFVSDTPEKADIAFLPGGSHPCQPEYAAKLYHEGYVRRFLVSGGLSVKLDKWPGVRERTDIYNGNYHSDCEFFSDALIKNGVPKSAVAGENQSGHTRDNAFFSRKRADELGLNIKKAIIVCKSFHARRCLMLYQLAFPDTELLVCPVDCHGITKDNWHTTEKGIDRVLGELSRCGNQFISDIKEYLI